MSTDNIEESRERIWDFIFRNGHQTVEDLAEQLGLTSPQVLECVNDDWFVVKDQMIFIATQSG